MSKIRLAMMGCGGMAGAHAERFAARSEVEIVALCDVTEEITERFRTRHLENYHPQPAIFTDHRRMYEVAQPDAVAIATPHTLHFAHASAALEAGCHVFLEKPMVTDSAQAHALAAKVAAVGKIFVIGYNTPCTPAIFYVRETIRTGTLGKLQLVSGWLSQDWKNDTAGTWRQKPELSGGGQMYDSGAHLFNTLVWTVEQPIEAVHAFVDNLDAPVDINGVVNIRFANGVLAAITIAGDCATMATGMTFLFENGRIECDGWNGRWIKAWNHKNQEIELALDSSATTGAAATTPNDNFIDAILGRATPRTSPLNGIHHSQLMDAIYKSARNGSR